MGDRSGGAAILLGVLALGTACATGIPADALQFKADTLARRQLQTRRFDTGDESRALSACAELLQDLGFVIDSSETDLGVIVASKERSAIEGGQVAAKVIVLLGTSMLMAPTNLPIDEKQQFRASIVSRPVGEHGAQVAVRVTFQRMVWNDTGVLSKLEALDEPEYYQQFFEMLSKSLFLEAHQL
jgi:hypothetical protein